MLASERKGNRHNHEDCERVKDPKIRKSLACKCGKCFICLRKGHRASNFNVENECNAWNRVHRVALCEKRPKEKDIHDEILKLDNERKHVPAYRNKHVTTPNSNLGRSRGQTDRITLTEEKLTGTRPTPENFEKKGPLKLHFPQFGRQVF